MAFNVITNTSHLGEYIEGGQGSDYIDGKNGNDTIVGFDGLDWLIGNNGNDKIFANQSDSDLDVVSGGNGNDAIYGGGGGDLMDGGAGDDRMGGGTGNDLMFGDSGVRSLDFYSTQASHYLSIDNPFAMLTALITGNEVPGEQLGFDDSYLNSFTQSGAGDDSLWGNFGRDMVFGGWGDDVAGGGSGNDLVVGNRGDDALYLSKGDDVGLGGDENDTIFGGAGNDIIDGDITPGEEDLMNCDESNDNWTVAAIDDQENDGVMGLAPVSASEDRGTNSYTIGNGYLNGTQWVSNESNHNGDDLLFGGAGSDILLGREGADTLWGGAGNDLMKGGMDDNGKLDNDTDVFGFTKNGDFVEGDPKKPGHGIDTVCEFNTAEWPEGGAAAYEDGEDVIYLEGGSYDGEFRDAVDAGDIVIDEAANLVTINTGAFGLGGIIKIFFTEDSDVRAFGAGNIALDDSEGWVDITSSFQFTEFDGGSSSGGSGGGNP